jgi:hypothetical protein
LVRKGRRGRKRVEAIVERFCRGKDGLIVCSGEERGIGGDEMGNVKGHY